MKKTQEQLPEELKRLLTETLQAVKARAATLYKDSPRDMITADLHYLVHEQLEEVLGSIDIDQREKQEIRQELGRLLHLLVERGKV